MNFNNWHQTILNKAQLHTGKRFNLCHYGETGVFNATNMFWIGSSELLDVLIMLDFEPLTSYTVNTIADRIIAIGQCNRNFIIAHSSLNFKGLPKVDNNDYWYFFSHAFIALDWFREYRFYTDTDLIKNKKFENAFMCLNHLTTNARNYRLLLVSRLLEKGLNKHGILTYQHYEQNDEKYIKFLPDSELCRLRGVTDSSVYDMETSTEFQTASANINIDMCNKSFLNVVTETCFYENFNHLTEKIFKPIVMLQPFILVSTVGNLDYLKSYGFKTFDKWIDESYDSIKNPFRRLDAITKEIEKICALTVEERDVMYQEMLPVLKHNRDLFFNRLYDIVNKEMWDNFDEIMKKGS